MAKEGLTRPLRPRWICTTVAGCISPGQFQKPLVRQLLLDAITAPRANGAWNPIL